MAPAAKDTTTDKGATTKTSKTSATSKIAAASKTKAKKATKEDDTTGAKGRKRAADVLEEEAPVDPAKMDEPAKTAKKDVAKKEKAKAKAAAAADATTTNASPATAKTADSKPKAKKAKTAKADEPAAAAAAAADAAAAAKPTPKKKANSEPKAKKATANAEDKDKDGAGAKPKKTKAAAAKDTEAKAAEPATVNGDKPKPKPRKRKAAAVEEDGKTETKTEAKAKAAVTNAAKKQKISKETADTTEDDVIDDGDVEDDPQTAALLSGFVSDDEDEGAASGDESRRFTEGDALPKIPGGKALTKRLKGASAGDGPGVIYIGRVPHGFHEHEMRAYFSQFGEVQHVRLSRSKRTGASKHYAFLQFSSSAVATIAAETMNNYLLFGHILKVKVVPAEQVHANLWKGADRRFKSVPWNKIEGRKLALPRARSEWEKKAETENQRRKSKADKLKEIGYEFDMPEVKGPESVPKKKGPVYELQPADPKKAEPKSKKAGKAKKSTESTEPAAAAAAAAAAEALESPAAEQDTKPADSKPKKAASKPSKKSRKDAELAKLPSDMSPSEIPADNMRAIEQGKAKIEVAKDGEVSVSQTEVRVTMTTELDGQEALWHGVEHPDDVDAALKKGKGKAKGKGKKGKAGKA